MAGLNFFKNAPLYLQREAKNFFVALSVGLRENI